MNTDPNIELLLEKTINGDLDAFSQIVIVLRPGLAAIVGRYADIDQDREDLLQDVFIKIFRTLKKYKGHGSFEGWTKKIAVGTSIDWLRAKMRRHYKTESDLSDDERGWVASRMADGSTLSPADEAEASYARQILRKGLDNLSPEDRTAIVLFEIEGMSVSEVSGMTGWSESNVKVKCHRARARLAKWMKDRGEKI